MSFFKKIIKNKKLLIIVGICLVITIICLVLFNGKVAKASGTVTEQRTYTVTNGELNVTLSGSGTVSPVNRKEIMVVVDGVVIESYLEEGKSFKEGDVILKLDNTDAQLNVKKLENSLLQKEVSMSDADISNDTLYVNSPIAGRISEIFVSEGSQVKKGDNLVTIVDESVLQAHIIFENTSVSLFNSIRNVKVQIPDYMTALTGRIWSVSQDGNNVSLAVSLDNPGALTTGLSVWGEIETSSGILTSEQGTLQNFDRETITADASGKVSNLSVYVDSEVGIGKNLMNLTDEALPYTIESDQLSLEQSGVELKLAKEKLDNYTIKAPFNGVAVAVANIDPNDSIESGTIIAILMDTSNMTFDVSIDELDISTVEIGQKVNVNADALPNEKMEGQVTSIAPEGNTSNGVTSYAVTVTIPGLEKLKSGMNVDAVIQVFNKDDALLVPVEAIQKQGNKYIVWVKGVQRQIPDVGESVDAPDSALGGEGEKAGVGKRQGGKQDNDVAANAASFTRNKENSNTDSYYSGASPVIVEVGMYNETYMEITGGLEAGDIIVLPPLATSNSSDNTSQTQGGAGFMMPGMGGGDMMPDRSNMRTPNSEGSSTRRGNQ